MDDVWCVVCGVWVSITQSWRNNIACIRANTLKANESVRGKSTRSISTLPRPQIPVEPKETSIGSPTTTITKSENAELMNPQGQHKFWSDVLVVHNMIIA